MGAITPTPGQTFRKNGLDFTVHFVEGGQVYGLLTTAGMDLEKFKKDYWAGRPTTGRVKLVRITEEEFERDAAGAVTV